MIKNEITKRATIESDGSKLKCLSPSYSTNISSSDKLDCQTPHSCPLATHAPSCLSFPPSRLRSRTGYASSLLLKTPNTN